MRETFRPLPRRVQWWRRTAERRKAAYLALRKAGRRGRTLAISTAGATLVAYGVYLAYAPAGYITGGLLLWALQWNYSGAEGSDG